MAVTLVFIILFNNLLLFFPHHLMNKNQMMHQVVESHFIYCLLLGGLKPPPLGGSFSKYFKTMNLVLDIRESQYIFLNLTIPQSWSLENKTELIRAKTQSNARIKWGKELNQLD